MLALSVGAVSAMKLLPAAIADEAVPPVLGEGPRERLSEFAVWKRGSSPWKPSSAPWRARMTTSSGCGRSLGSGC